MLMRETNGIQSGYHHPSLYDKAPSSVHSGRLWTTGSTDFNVHKPEIFIEKQTHNMFVFKRTKIQICISSDQHKRSSTNTWRTRFVSLSDETNSCCF